MKAETPEGSVLLCAHPHPQEQFETLSACCKGGQTFPAGWASYETSARERLEPPSCLCPCPPTQPTCPTHGEEALRYFCLTCVHPVCRVCTELNHRSHTCARMKRDACSKRAEIEGLCSQIKGAVGKVMVQIARLSSILLAAKEVKSAEARVKDEGMESRAADVTSALVRSSRDDAEATSDRHHIKRLKRQWRLLDSEVERAFASLEICASVLREGGRLKALQLAPMLAERLRALSEARRSTSLLVPCLNSDSIPELEESHVAAALRESSLAAGTGQSLGVERSSGSASRHLEAHGEPLPGAYSCNTSSACSHPEAALSASRKPLSAHPGQSDPCTASQQTAKFGSESDASPSHRDTDFCYWEITADANVGSDDDQSGKALAESRLDGNDKAIHQPSPKQDSEISDRQSPSTSSTDLSKERSQICTREDTDGFGNATDATVPGKEEADMKDSQSCSRHSRDQDLVRGLDSTTSDLRTDSKETLHGRGHTMTEEETQDTKPSFRRVLNEDKSQDITLPKEPAINFKITRSYKQTVVEGHLKRTVELPENTLEATSVREPEDDLTMSPRRPEADETSSSSVLNLTMSKRHSIKDSLITITGCGRDLIMPMRCPDKTLRMLVPRAGDVVRSIGQSTEMDTERRDLSLQLRSSFTARCKQDTELPLVIGLAYSGQTGVVALDGANGTVKLFTKQGQLQHVLSATQAARYAAFEHVIAFMGRILLNYNKRRTPTTTGRGDSVDHIAQEGSTDGEKLLSSDLGHGFDSFTSAHVPNSSLIFSSAGDRTEFDARSQQQVIVKCQSVSGTEKKSNDVGDEEGNDMLKTFEKCCSGDCGGSPAVHRPYFLCVQRNGNVIIVDKDTSCLSVLDPRGNTLLETSILEFGLSSPIHVVNDGGSTLLLSDKEACLYVLKIVSKRRRQREISPAF